jgi:tRNA(Ile)-lysidine synthetase-like protein
MKSQLCSNNVERALSDYWLKWGIPPRATIFAAYSGGGDSSSLSLALQDFQSVKDFTLCLAYLDHGIRPLLERRAEAEHVRAFASRYAIPLIADAIEPGRVEALARMEKIGIEAAARKLRYAFFASLLANKENAFVFLGHTADDQIETVLMRAFSGSGLRGMRGIAEKRGRFCRPFLGLYHNDLTEYLDERSCPYFADSTNASNEYLRNGVRNILRPEIAGLFPGYERGLLNCARKMALVEADFDRRLSELVPSPADGVPLALYENMSLALRLHLLERMAQELAPGKRVPFGLLSAALRFKETVHASRRVIAQGAGIVICADSRKLWMERRLALKGKKGYFFVVGSSDEISLPPEAGFALRWNAKRGDGLASRGFSFPAALRSIASGDYITIKDGKKSILTIMNEWAVPLSLISSIPVLEDCQGVACVFGKAFGFRDRYAERGITTLDDDTMFLELVRDERIGE